MCKWSVCVGGVGWGQGGVHACVRVFACVCVCMHALCI